MTAWFERRKDVATFLLRLLLGARLVWGTQDSAGRISVDAARHQPGKITTRR